jgi:hypothetical protein
MAEATSQLQRIASLVEQAGSISKKQRGMRIEAEDWNLLVDILLGVLQVERLQEESQQTQLEEKFALRNHEHLGEVSLAWLDPDLQSRIGGGGNVSTRQVLADMDRRIQNLRDEVMSLQTVVDTHQRALDRSAVDELDRSKALRDFQARFDSVSNLKTAVNTLSSDVGSLRANVDSVLELKKSLSDAQGNPIDVAGMRKELTDLQGIRESLNGIDGKPLTLRDLEVRLTDVANAVGVGGSGSLDKRFADFSAALESRLTESNKAAIAEGISGVRAENAALEAKLHSEIESTAAQTLAAASTETARQITAFGVQQKSALDQQFAANNAVLSAATLDAARAMISQQMATVPEIARAAAQTAASDAGRSVAADLQAKFTADIAAQIQASEARIDARLKPLEAGLPELKNSLPDLISGRVQTSVTALQSSLAQQVTTQVNGAQQQIQTALAGQVTSTVNSALAGLDGRISSALNAQMPALNAQINQAVTAATKNLNEEVASEVGRQLTALNLDAKISGAVKDESQRLQTTFSSQLTAQEARLTTLINTTAAALRGESKALLDSSLAQIKNEILSNVDAKISASRTVIERPGGLIPH